MMTKVQSQGGWGFTMCFDPTGQIQMSTAAINGCMYEIYVS